MKSKNTKKYYMKLQNTPFIKIKEESKTIELRLNDEKRRKCQKGDFIIFTNIETKEEIMVKIVEIYKFKSFQELYKKIDLKKCGYENIHEADHKDMEAFYSEEQQRKYGVLGIEIKKLG